MKKLITKNIELKAFIYLLPALCVITVFQIYPIFKSFIMGFYVKFDYLTDTVYETGFDNFKYVLSDENFILALKNTTIFAGIAAPVGIIVALLFALILNSIKRFQGFFRSMFFLPFVTSTTAIAVIFRWMLNKDYGIVNSFLTTLGMAKIDWLTNPKMTIPILVFLSVWKGLGYRIIIILAALQNIDKKYYLASRIDGASNLKSIFYITLPLIKPSIIFLSITSVISSFKLFDEVYILYGQKPGPIQSGLTIVYYIFDKFYSHWEFATAAAAAFILFCIILFFTVIQLIFTRNKD